MQVTFPAAMNPGKAIFPTYLMLVCAGTAVLGACDWEWWWWMAGCVLAALPCTYFSGREWLMRTVVRVSPGAISIGRSIFGIGRTEAVTVTPELAITVDKQSGVRGPFQVQIIQAGRRIRLGGMLESAREADTLCGIMQKRLRSHDQLVERHHSPRVRDEGRSETSTCAIDGPPGGDCGRWVRVCG